MEHYLSKEHPDYRLGQEVDILIWQKDVYKRQVGAYAAEMICRAGVGRMTIVDADIVQPSNINRQL